MDRSCRIGPNFALQDRYIVWGGFPGFWRDVGRDLQPPSKPPLTLGFVSRSIIALGFTTASLRFCVSVHGFYSRLANLQPTGSTMAIV